MLLAARKATGKKAASVSNTRLRADDHTARRFNGGDVTPNHRRRRHKLKPIWTQR